MAESGESKLLSDLKVSELRSELEKRGLDKNGIKIVLSMRLEKALVEEGHEPATFLFAGGESSALPSPKKAVSSNADSTLSESGKEIGPDGIPAGEQEVVVAADAATAAAVTAEEQQQSPQTPTDETPMDDDSVGQQPLHQEQQIEQHQLQQQQHQHKEDVAGKADEAEMLEDPLVDDGSKKPDAQGSNFAASNVVTTSPNVSTSTASAAKNPTSTSVLPTAEEADARSLWIRGITKETSAATLKTLCNKFGKVVRAKIFTSRPKKGQDDTCFGFVTFLDVDMANKCCAELHGTAYNNKTLVVKKASESSIRSAKVNPPKEPSVEAKPVAEKKETAKVEDSKPEVKAKEAESKKEDSKKVDVEKGGTSKAAERNDKEGEKEKVKKRERIRMDSSSDRREKTSSSRREHGRVSESERRRVPSSSRFTPSHHRGFSSRHVTAGIRRPMSTRPIGRMHDRVSRPIGLVQRPAERMSISTSSLRRPATDSWGRVDYEELLRKKEEEHRKKELELEFEREREKIRYEREKLEREKLEIQLQATLQEQQRRAELEGSRMATPVGGMPLSSSMRFYEPPTTKGASRAMDYHHMPSSLSRDRDRERDQSRLDSSRRPREHDRGRERERDGMRTDSSKKVPMKKEIRSKEDDRSRSSHRPPPSSSSSRPVPSGGRPPIRVESYAHRLPNSSTTSRHNHTSSSSHVSQGGLSGRSAANVGYGNVGSQFSATRTTYSSGAAGRSDYAQNSRIPSGGSGLGNWTAPPQDSTSFNAWVGTNVSDAMHGGSSGWNSSGSRAPAASNWDYNNVRNSSTSSRTYDFQRY